jgi:murein DD-endopeptidase MepM/ murein hydrolase activator NlpD
VTGGGLAVRAAGPGTVTFAGTIAGRGVVVLRHAGPLRTTYEPVLAEVPVGRTVVRGQQIGVLQPMPQHCAGQPCLHWGARSGDAYLDPLSLLTGARRPPVLLPLGITAGRA